MVGYGVGDSRSKEADGMMALHEALRSVCLNSDWAYSVFWTIRPRPRCRGGNGCKVGEENGSLMLMWEDGFCRPRMADCMQEMEGEDPVRKVFSKMSIQLYNYGEGLMGKVASDKCHKWVFKEPSDHCEPNISNYWQSSFDAVPSEWIDQFACGIQTIAVIQAGHGLLQLGSCKIIPEDLHFVLRMRHMFESLGYQSGFFLSQLFTSTVKQPPPSRPPPPIFNWNQPVPIPTTSMHGGFHHSDQMGMQHNNKEDTLFLLPRSPEHQMQDMIPNHESDIKWPNGLSFFTALTARSDDAKLLFGAEVSQHPMRATSQVNLCGSSDEGNRGESSNAISGTNTEDYLSLDNNKFNRGFTLPNRMASSSSSSSLDPRSATTTQPGEYRGSEAGIYSDIMENFMD